MAGRPARRVVLFTFKLQWDAMTEQGGQEVFHRQARIAFFDPVQIRKPVSVLTQGVDLGPGGIGLRSGVQLPAGAVEMGLFGGRTIFLGTVRWVKPVGSGFRVGVEFSQEDASLLTQVQSMLAGAKPSAGSKR